MCSSCSPWKIFVVGDVDLRESERLGRRTFETRPQRIHNKEQYQPPSSKTVISQRSADFFLQETMVLHVMNILPIY